MLRTGAGKLSLFALIVGLCAIRAFTGLIGSRAFSHDAFMLLDGAWRMMNGQRPHVDFYSHVGFLTYVPTVVGLWLSHGTAWGFGYGQAIVALLLGIWAYLAGRHRLWDVPLALFCLAVTFLAVTPVALGFSPMKPGPAMIYNRQGYALIALLLMEAFQESRVRSRRGDFWGGVSSGIVVSLLFFLKITYFAVAVFLVCALLRSRKQYRERWFGLMSGSLLTLVICLSYYNFGTGALVRDLVTIGGGKHIHFGFYLLDEITKDALVMAALALGAGLLLRERQQRRAAASIVLSGLVMTFAGTGLLFGNFEPTGFPLAVVISVLLLNNTLIRLPAGRGGQPDFFHGAVLVFGSALIAGFFFSGAAGMMFALAQRVVVHNEKPFHLPLMKGFTAGQDDEAYAAFVNDGISLVQRNRKPSDTIMSLDFTNPFSFGFQMRPAFGGTPVLQYGTTFSDRFKPSPEFLLGAAELVIVPKKASDPTLDDNVPRLYGPYLQDHYRQLDESRDWRLYRKN